MSAATLKAAQKKRLLHPPRVSRPLTLPKEKMAPMATMLLLLKSGCRTTAVGDMDPGGSSFTSPRALFVLRQARLTPTFTPNLRSHDTDGENAGLSVNWRTTRTPAQKRPVMTCTPQSRNQLRNQQKWFAWAYSFQMMGFICCQMLLSFNVLSQFYWSDELDYF